jgi:hypothetical protein
MRIAFLLLRTHRIEHYAKNQDYLAWNLTEICSFLEIPFIHVLLRSGRRFGEICTFVAQNWQKRTLCKNQDSVAWKLTEICSFLEIPFIHILARTATRFHENCIFAAQNSQNWTLCKKTGLSSLKIDWDILISWNPVYPRFGENWDEISRDLHLLVRTHQIEHYAKNQDYLAWKFTEICSFF